MKQLLVPVVGLTALLMVAPAQATLMQWMNEADQAVTYSDTGAWDFTLTRADSAVDRGAQPASANVGTLYVGLTETGFDLWGDYQQYMVQTTGYTDAHLSVSNFIDPSNTPWGQDDVLHDAQYWALFKDETWSIEWAGEQFSLTTGAAIVHDGDSPQTMAFSNLVSVNTPGTLTLLAIGFVGLGLSRRPGSVAEVSPT